MPDLYEMLIGAPPSGPEETKATARELRRQQRHAMLGMMTGDQMMGQAGKALHGQTQRQVEGLQQSRQKGIQEQRLQDFEQNQLDRWADTDAVQVGVRDQAQENWEARMQFDRDKMDQGNALKLALQEMKSQETRKETDKAVTSMSKELVKANVPQLETAYSQLNEVLSPYMNEDGSIKGDIPGAGATGIGPTMFLGPEGREVRSVVANVRNQVMKMMSGAAVTDPEAARLYEQIGQYLGGSDEDIIRGLTNLQAMSENNRDTIMSGYSDAAISEWDRRRGGRGDPTAATNAATVGNAQSYLDAAAGGM